jgi:protein-L-isoaspartate(D-aspartate) O-methyltransferase
MRDEPLVKYHHRRDVHDEDPPEETGSGVAAWFSRPWSSIPTSITGPKGFIIGVRLRLWSIIFSCLVLAVHCSVNMEEPGEVLAQERSSFDEYGRERRRMVDEQIRARGVRDPSVLRAMEKVERHKFVPANVRSLSYADGPLPIGLGQTISQPYIVAYMTEVIGITREGKVLEIGTGSGYQAAVLAELAREVYSIEILPELADGARRVLEELGCRNVFVKAGNGYLGWPERGPFDAIVVTAAPDEIPKALIDQLAVGGKMVIPVGTADQQMVIVTKTRDGVTEKRTLPVRFVPMTGKP